MSELKMVPVEQVRKVVTEAMVSMVSGVTGMIPPSGPGAIPDFVQGPIDRAVDRIAAMLASAPAPVDGQEAEELAWKALFAATDLLDRRAAPHAWISEAYAAGSKVITDARSATPIAQGEHSGDAAQALAEILAALPANREWLCPVLEAQARILAAQPTQGASE